MSIKEAISKTPERRVRRTPVGQRNVLTISGQEAGYQYRFVNDSGDRVQEFLDNGWEKVPAKKVRVGDKRIGVASEEGTDATAAVGQGERAYVLRIRQDWFDEDQAVKQTYVNQTEEATREKSS